MIPDNSPIKHRIVLVGAGAIGLAIASAFLRSGHSVTVCGGSHAINEITVTENGQTESWPVRHITTPEALDTGPTLAILAVKAHQTLTTRHWLNALSRPDVTLIIAQNGVEQAESVAPFVKECSVVPAIVYLNVERTQPGSIILRRAGETDLALPNIPACNITISKLRTGGLRVAPVDDFITVAWTKLLTNITANPLTALTGRRADIMREAGIEEIAIKIMNEAAEVGRAEGARLTSEHVKQAMIWLQNVPPGSTTSMRQDRLAGRPMEYDALTGAVIRAATRHGIETPVNQLVYALLSVIKSDNS